MRCLVLPMAARAGAWLRRVFGGQLMRMPDAGALSNACGPIIGYYAEKIGRRGMMRIGELFVLVGMAVTVISVHRLDDAFFVFFVASYVVNQVCVW